jgi:hypothetical protein
MCNDCTATDQLARCAVIARQGLIEGGRGLVCGVRNDSVFWTWLCWLYFVVGRVFFFFGLGLLRSIINLGAVFMCDISRDVAPLPRKARHAHRATGLWHVFRLLRSGGEWLSGDCAERRHSVMSTLHGLVCALDSFNVAQRPLDRAKPPIQTPIHDSTIRTRNSTFNENRTMALPAESKF